MILEGLSTIPEACIMPDSVVAISDTLEITINLADLTRLSLILLKRGKETHM